MIARSLRIIALIGALALPASAAEQVVAGLSDNQIAITATFNGSEILVFGAAKRDTPVPPGPPLQVIVTLQGPATPVNVRKKGHELGIWVNTASVRINSAPSFYAIATSDLMPRVLSATDDLRYHVSIPQVIGTVGTASMAPDAPSFVEALIRIRKEEGLYVLDEGAVEVDQSTLFRTRIKLPANLTEGRYKARIFLTRDGHVIAEHDTGVFVRKAGLERWLYQLAKQQAAIYGFLSLVIAVVAGWLASAAFRLFKR
ncbi:putative transmembrane protein (alph_Pro_TM) [mine drainage metagenome]|uniref:Putative transmembrane protein (Alph_Pro_TM) n=1 Tax=mine drainage metagenome TaxID=410659 RepID=A0A1J5PXZ6_9ZZZZ